MMVVAKVARLVDWMDALMDVMMVVNWVVWSVGELGVTQGTW